MTLKVTCSIIGGYLIRGAGRGRYRRSPVLSIDVTPRDALFVYTSNPRTQAAEFGCHTARIHAKGDTSKCKVKVSHFGHQGHNKLPETRTALTHAWYTLGITLLGPSHIYQDLSARVSPYPTVLVSESQCQETVTISYMCISDRFFELSCYIIFAFAIVSSEGRLSMNATSASVYHDAHSAGVHAQCHAVASHARLCDHVDIIFTPMYKKSSDVSSRSSKPNGCMIDSDVSTRAVMYRQCVPSASCRQLGDRGEQFFLGAYVSVKISV